MNRYIPVFILPIFLLAGCGTVTEYLRGDDNVTPPTPLTQFDSALSVRVNWSANIGKASHGYLVNLRPFIADGRVYVAGGGGNVTAFDAKTGQTIWDVDTKARLGGGPGVGDGLVLVGTRDGEVIALDSNKGREIWRSRVTSEVLSVPSTMAGVVVARAIDGRLFGLSAIDGKRLWIHDRTVPVLTLRGSSSPVLVKGAVIYGSDSGRLSVLSLKEGLPYWEKSVAFPSGHSELDRIVDIDGDPLVIKDTIYVASYQGSIVALDLKTAGTLWKRNFSSFNGMSADKNNLYITDDEGNVWALDRNSGASIWKQNKLAGRRVSGPAVLGDYVVVGDFEGYLHWMSAADGRFVARVKTGSAGIGSRPLSDGKQLYSISKDGDLTVLSIQ